MDGINVSTMAARTRTLTDVDGVGRQLSITLSKRRKSARLRIDIPSKGNLSLPRLHHGNALRRVWPLISHRALFQIVPTVSLSA